MVGLIAPKSEVEKLRNEISSEKLSLDTIQAKLNVLHLNYDDYSWNWVKDVLAKLYGKSLEQFDIKDFDTIIEKWKKSVETFNDLILRDAKKEFNSISKTGFGLDGNEDQKNIDFEATRGTFEENAFAKGMKK